MVSDRSNGINWGFVAAIVGLALLSIGAGIGLDQQSAYEQRAAQKAADYSRTAADQITEACAGIPSAERRLCLEKEAGEYRLKARDNKREYDDLAAQQTAALWAKIMGIAALIGMALSAVGVWLVKTTFDETRKANTISKEIMFRQLRAYVTVESLVDVNMSGGMSITLHNSGATPASGVKVVYDKLQVSDGVLSYVKTGIEVADIGAQARKSIPLEWYVWRDIFDAKLKNPDVLVGSLIYLPVVPDDKGRNRELVEQFRIEKSDSECKRDLRVEITRLPRDTHFA